MYSVCVCIYIFILHSKDSDLIGGRLQSRISKGVPNALSLFPTKDMNVLSAYSVRLLNNYLLTNYVAPEPEGSSPYSQ
jgi:hypothetical protein